MRTCSVSACVVCGDHSIVLTCRPFCHVPCPETLTSPTDYVDHAVRHVMMRQGVLGVTVSIMLPHDPTVSVMPSLDTGCMKVPTRLPGLPWMASRSSVVVGVSCMARFSAILSRILKRGSMCVLCKKLDHLFFSCKAKKYEKVTRHMSYH